MPLLPITSKNTLTKCSAMQCDGSEIFICSYPKSGTTWTQNIVYTLVSKGDDQFTHISEYAPFFEIDATWEEGGELIASIARNHQKIQRRIFNTHLRWEQMPKHPGARYVYLVRDGMDVCASFFYHLSSQVEGGYTGTSAQFLEEWLSGNIAFGKWSDHLKSWLGPDKTDERVLVVRYEELKSNLQETVSKIALHCKISITEDEIIGLLPKFSFDYMRSHKSQFQPQSVTWKDGFQFIRKGEIGGHHELFSIQQKVAFRRALIKEFPGQLCKQGMLHLALESYQIC
mmetsp:Transcript_34615/g.57095  ORF Transcript_34615/g.57095 Transcript_34615/m.57095 type:complete len:286 (+) Transcript_34615:1-858(+)